MVKRRWRPKDDVWEQRVLCVAVPCGLTSPVSDARNKARSTATQALSVHVRTHEGQRDRVLEWEEREKDWKRPMSKQQQKNATFLRSLSSPLSLPLFPQSSAPFLGYVQWSNVFFCLQIFKRSECHTRGFGLSFGRVPLYRSLALSLSFSLAAFTQVAHYLQLSTNISRKL